MLPHVVIRFKTKMRINSISPYNLRSNTYCKKNISNVSSQKQSASQNINFGWIRGMNADNAILTLKNPEDPDNKKEFFGERHFDGYLALQQTPVLEFTYDYDKNKYIKFGDPCRLDVVFRPAVLYKDTEKQRKREDKILKGLYKKFGIKPGRNEILGEYKKLVELGEFVDKKLPISIIDGVVDHLYGSRDEHYITVLGKEKKGGFFNPGKIVSREQYILKPYFPKIIEREDGKIEIDRTHATDLPEGFEFIGEGRLPIKRGLF